MSKNNFELTLAGGVIPVEHYGHLLDDESYWNDIPLRSEDDDEEYGDLEEGDIENS